MDANDNPLQDSYRKLLNHYGEQAWWPADDSFEILIGAILTQNTAWSNVEKAIANLKQHGLCDSQALAEIDPQALAPIIRPSGYFNQKAERLVRFSRWYLEQGGFLALRRMPMDKLRRLLLTVNGIGDETADDMLLYAFAKPSFVIDAYTRRLLSRLGLVKENLGYARLQLEFHRELDEDVELYQQYHALIVSHAKQHCRKQPLCPGCPLRSDCQYANDNQA